MTPAPLFAEAEGPAGEATWLRAPDGTKLRAALWPAASAKGTVLLLPGRTEYVEKYGRTARDLTAAGLTTLTIDFRGQGLSARALRDPVLGHVTDFAEYQQDLDALLSFAQAQGLPQPFHLLAHSMGGTIGLRALLRGLPFKTAVFTGPMWGILMAPIMRPISRVLPRLAAAFGQAHRYVPTTGPGTYVLDAAFLDNTLTTDPDQWDYMRRQALAHPEMSLGGPSLAWLRAALTECRALSRLPSPKTPTLIALGTHERIVDPAPILTRAATWPEAQLHRIDGAEHEILMERPAIRAPFLQAAIAHFS